QTGQMWNQHQTQPSMQKMPMQMPVKQPFFMPTQDPMKLFEHPMSMQPPQPSMDKKMKFLLGAFLPHGRRGQERNGGKNGQTRICPEALHM
ncbi:hypothetical protein M9458_004199, partial [Cirrhinus mrigala]